MAACVRSSNGAPDVLLARCAKIYTGTDVRTMTEHDRQGIASQNTAMAQQALRVLGSAYRDLDKDSPADLMPSKRRKPFCPFWLSLTSQCLQRGSATTSGSFPEFECHRGKSRSGYQRVNAQPRGDRADCAFSLEHFENSAQSLHE